MIHILTFIMIVGVFGRYRQPPIVVGSSHRQCYTLGRFASGPAS